MQSSEKTCQCEQIWQFASLSLCDVCNFHFTLSVNDTGEDGEQGEAGLHPGSWLPGSLAPWLLAPWLPCWWLLAGGLWLQLAPWLPALPSAPTGFQTEGYLGSTQVFCILWDLLARQDRFKVCFR